MSESCCSGPENLPKKEENSTAAGAPPFGRGQETAVPAGGFRPRAGGGDAERGRPLTTEVCCEFHPPQRCGPAKCPECGELGKTVRRITLGALLKAEKRPEIPKQEEFCFCRSAACGVVYFIPDRMLFRKEDLSVPVGLKEPQNPKAPVCYCFSWTPEKIQAEIRNTSKSTAIDRIKAQVKDGNCYCEITNPQGSCCLGNVSKVVKEIREGL